MPKKKNSNNQEEKSKNNSDQKNQKSSKESGEQKLSKAAYTIADSLAHLLEDVLDSGLIVAGDVKLKVSDLELLIKLRLIVTMIDKARHLGIDWWDQDRFYTTSEPTEFQKLKGHQMALERQLSQSTQKRTKKRGGKKSRSSKKRK